MQYIIEFKFKKKINGKQLSDLVIAITNLEYYYLKWLMTPPHFKDILIQLCVII